MRKDANQLAYGLVKSVTDRLDPPLKDYQEILQLIREVNPSDWETMDQIDGRFWCYLNNKKFKSVKRSPNLNCLHLKIEHPNEDDEAVTTLREYYSQSRDALKFHRPKGWVIEIRATWSGDEILFYEGVACQLGGSWAEKLEGRYHFKTEELAELYCLIMVIAFERGELK